MKHALIARWTALPAPARTWGPLAVALIVLLSAYLATLQQDITGSADDYVKDAGEIQVALNLWGTIHYTGYPLYTMLGASLVALLRLLGLNAATAAALPSLLFSLVALGLVYALIVARTRRAWLASSMALALGLTESAWMHSVIAEVYSLYLLVAALIAWWALKDDRAWTRRDWLIAALILGLGVGHHRGLAFLIPGLAVWLGPEIWRQRRRMPLILLLGALVFAATFAVYLYLPARAWAGARWVYGQPGTWNGFWQQFTGEEARLLMVPPADAADLAAHVRYILRVLADQLTRPGVGIALAALGGLLALPEARRMGAALLVGTGSYLAFAVWLPEAVLAPAFLLPAVMLFLLGAAFFAAHVAARTAAPLPASMAAGAAGALAAALLWINLPAIRSVTADDTHGRAVIEQAAQLPADVLAGDPALMLPWSAPYFSVSYAVYVTGELEGVTPVDHRANIAAILEEGRPLITMPITFYTFPPDNPSVWLGPIHLSSAGPGLIRIRRAPLIASPDELGGEGAPLGNGIALVDWSLAVRPDGAYWVTATWRADGVPQADYSLFAHLLTTPEPTEPAHLLAQADTAAPVYGWYPTTRWSAGEIVRDDFILTPPADYSGLIYLSVGMYRQQPDGSFENFRGLVQQVR